MDFRRTLLSVLVLVCGVCAAPHDKLSSFTDGQECGGKPVELMFLLDSSSSIWSVDFDRQLKFVSQVVEIFDVSEEKARIGVASFSDGFVGNIALDRYDTKEDIQKAVLGIRQLLGGTMTYDALDELRIQGFNPNVVRPGVTKVAIVMTDGVSYNKGKTAAAAKRLKDEGVFVFAVGIGRADDEELRSIASEPASEFVFSVKNFRLLEKIKIDLALKACEVKVQDEAPLCGAKNAADIMFLMDPAELGAANTKQVYDFVGSVVRDFDMASGNIRVGMESRNCGARNIGLDEFSEGQELVKHLRNTELPGLHHMFRKLHRTKHQPKTAYHPVNGGRDRARHMAVVFVDDRLQNAKQVLEEARLAKLDDVELFVVAIGDSVVSEELKTLCSSSTERHIIEVASYEELGASKPKFLQQFCHGL